MKTKKDPKESLEEGLDFSKSYYMMVDPKKKIDDIELGHMGSTRYSNGEWFYFTKKELIGEFYDEGTMVAEIKPIKSKYVKIIKTKERVDRWMAERVEIKRFIDRIEFLSEIGDQEGNLKISGIKTLKNVNIPNVKLGLYLDSIEELENVNFGSIGGDASFRNLINMEKVSFNGTIGGNLYLDKVKKAKNVQLPKIDLNLYLNGLEIIEGVKFNDVKGHLFLSGIKEMKGIELPKIGRDLYIQKLKKIEKVVFNEIKGDLHIYDLGTYQEEFIMNKVKGDIYVERFDKIKVDGE